ncbi:MAG: histidine phosphatase family protein [Betaproteobacteria bacterium]|nr:histidine phosphatase family protein [Betaproteobacteria bacterium]
MTTTLVLIRHGETEWNRQGRIQGHLDSPLTPEGVAQAKACATRLRDEHFDQVVSSDLPRVRRTADLLIESRGLPIRFDAALRERSYGIGEGLTYAEMDSQHPEFFSRIRTTDPDYAVEGSESRREFHQRITNALRGIAKDHAGQRVLVVTHGGVLGVVYRWLNGLHISSPHKVEIPNVAYNRVSVHPKEVGEDWKLEVWADTAHLDTETSEPA